MDESSPSVLFARGVNARLAIWSTLRVAVQEGWGGPDGAEKRARLASEIIDAFQDQSQIPDDQYIEEILLQIMVDDYDAVLEDGSAESVARDIVQLWEETSVGKADGVARFEEMADKVKGKKQEVEILIQEDEEWEDEDGEEGNSTDEEAP
ncbi:hypothetical protein H0H81_003113 [Sphagnurus paluster]|uniref:Pre-rRNA-processing protein TSR2 homolog n=1 Tax=Sphagnurus paluster TaxID=117069 RepID=A0A9P7GMN9_9AGAR|nr:hypothetical protein H0H81_003113 [Sphagnurus paluster]